MANKENIDFLLTNIRELERLVADVRDAEVYPVSFFSQTFDLAHKVLSDLHALEADQVERLSRQMEEHRLLLQNIPRRQMIPQPLPSEQEKEDIRESLDKVLEEQIEVIEENIPVQSESETEEPVNEPQILIEEETEIVEVSLPETEESAETELSVTTTTSTIVTDKSVLSLNEILEKKQLSDFRKAFSLNDRFRFRRELFGGDEAKMNKAITDLNDIHSYEESMAYLKNDLGWQIEDEAVVDFIKLLEKRFL